MKKTVILASAVALLMSCGDNGKRVELEQTDVAGNTWTLKSGIIKGLSADFAGDNELYFGNTTTKDFKLIEKGTARTCDDDSLKTKEGQILATGTWDFDGQKKELTVTLSEVDSYALPFAKEAVEFKITGLEKDDKTGQVYGETDKLYDQKNSCKDLSNADNIKDIKGAKISFSISSGETTDEKLPLTADKLTNTSWSAEFKKGTADAVTKAEYAVDNLLSFVSANQVTYVEAGEVRPCQNAPTKKGTRLAQKDVNLKADGSDDFEKAPTWAVDEGGSLTITVSKSNASQVAYLLPFAPNPASSSTEDITFTIKDCKVNAAGTEITGTMDAIYDLKTKEAAKNNCTDLSDKDNLTKVTGTIQVTLTKEEYNEGYAQNRLTKNAVIGKLLKVKDFMPSGGAKTSPASFLADNTLALLKDGSDMKWIYNEGETTAYSPSCIDESITEDSEKGAITVIKSDLAKGTVEFNDPTDSTKVELVLKIDQVTAGTGVAGFISAHPYLIPFSNVDPAAAIATDKVTITLPKFIDIDASEIQATMDYYQPKTGDDLCEDNSESTPKKKIAKALAGNGNSNKKASATVTLTLETPSKS